jgi:cell division ATPase FtsA
MFGFGAKSIVGLDVGSSSIKAVELKKTRTGIEAVHVGLEPLGPDMVVDSMIVDSGTVSAAISKLFNDGQIKSKDDVSVQYQLVPTGQTNPVAQNSLQAKAKSDGEDVLTPLLTQAATNVLTKVSQK